MKEYRKARQIAENIVFGEQQQITLEQKEILKKSPFANTLAIIQKPDSPFLTLAEKVLEKTNFSKNKNEEEKVSTENNTYSSKNKLRFGYNKGEILELIACIEDHFKLNVPYDYNNLDLEKLKEFVSQYAEDKIFDEDVQKLVKRINEKDSPEEIMATLRFYVRH
jgi:hypothetical protein